MQGRRRRVASIAAAIAVGGLAALPQAAFADLLAPDSPASGSASAGRTIYVIMSILGALVVLAVVAAIVRAVRSSGGAAEDAEPARRTRGTSALQKRVGLGLGCAALVLFVVGVIFTEQVRDVEASTSDAEPIVIQADGQQWIWRYEYPIADMPEDGYSPDAPYSYHDLVVPVDTPITLEVGSTDVLHRWWVPALARAADAVPGLVNEVHFTADETGTFQGRSTEFSGQGYSTMRTEVQVVEQDEYEAFLADRIEAIEEARSAVQKRVDEGTAPGVKFEK